MRYDAASILRQWAPLGHWTPLLYCGCGCTRTTYYYYYYYYYYYSYSYSYRYSC